jgi:hypothetical protein
MSPLKFFRYTLLFSFLILGMFGTGAAQADPLTAYDDQFQNGFTLWGWSGLVYDLNHTTTVKYGWRAISMEPDAWRALFLHRDAGIDTVQYSGIEFWIHGGATGGQKLRIRGANGGSPIGVGESLNAFLPSGSIPAGQWVHVRVPFARLGLLSGTFDGIWFQDDSGGDQPAFMIDDIELMSPSTNSVYDDQLRNGFVDWGWAVRDFAQTSVVRTGGTAISFEPDGWAAVFFHRDAGIDFSDYSGIEFWIHGGATGGQRLRIALLSVGTPVASLSLQPYIQGVGAVPAGRWALAKVPFSAFGNVSGIDGFWIQDDTGGDQQKVYIDDVQLSLGTVKVQISPEAGRLPISPFIYGVNFGSRAQADRMRWPVRRWGGNATTRYSWQYDVANRGFDWFFLNAPETLPVPPALPYGSAADRFVQDTRATGGEALVTLPTIGWTPVDGQRRPGFAVDKYGPQQLTECTWGDPSWCDPNAGNGVHPNGTYVTGNDPHDTSREADPTFVTDWMAHLASQFGTVAQGGVKLYALDNEPMLWDSTHRDVHPSPVTYDELWQKTVAYASAIKAQDPNAQIFGPVTWGWCDLFASAADHPGDCTNGDDRAAHGNTPILEWYLQQVRDYQIANGVRLVDWVDIHFYPQGHGINLSNDEGTSASLRRLRSLRSLYDPTYVDESWIGQPVNLIPRVKQWINSRLPGARLAITEYNWGDGGLSSALAQAEALAIFGRQGVGLAARWEAPKEYSLVEDAFRLYLNYDGQGGRVSGSSVKTVSSQVDSVGAYTVWADNSGTQDRIYVLLFNKDTVQRRVDVALTTWGTTGAQPILFRLDELGGLRQVSQSVSVNPKGFILDLPARSATLAVLPLCPGGQLCF